MVPKTIFFTYFLSDLTNTSFMELAPCPELISREISRFLPPEVSFQVSTTFTLLPCHAIFVLILRVSPDHLLMLVISLPRTVFLVSVPSVA